MAGKFVEFGIQGVGAALAAGSALRNSYTRTKSNRTMALKETVPSGGTNDLHRRRMRTGRSKRWSNSRCKQAVLGNLNETILRCQSASQTFIGPGKVFLGWADHPLFNGLQQQPCHFISLTSVGPLSNSQTAKGCYQTCLKKLYYQDLSGSYDWATMNVNQTYTGAFNAQDQWQVEKNDRVGGLSVNNQDFYHKYTDIRMNLYGCVRVPITYTIMLCTMKEQVDPLQFNQAQAFGTGTELNNFCRDLMRPRIYDNLSSNASPKWHKDVNIIRSKQVTINPPARSDAAEFGGLPGPSTVYELKWFVRHDRKRDYQWTKDPSRDNVMTNGGWDVTGTEVLCDVEWGKRVFLFIMANSSVKESFATFDAEDPDKNYSNAALQNYSGSYDVVIRNSFLSR